jgi:hypothetical protein
MITVLLFIDFRKAFDTVDADLLILKLKHYGFDNQSLNLVKNYFTNRSQATKLNGERSAFNDILLGVPQGDVLGPLFFLIFINDLIYYLLYTDPDFSAYTTGNEAGDDLTVLIESYKTIFSSLNEGYHCNRIDIKFAKTYIIFITKKHIKLPKCVDIKIEVVEHIKMLGVTLDNKLNFAKHITLVCQMINRKMFSIKRLFQLSFSVKIQFSKHF